MPRLISSLVQLRRDPRILKLPPYLSLLCILVGVASLLVLPLDGYSRRTYISENALLPGQVHTYFGGSDQHVFRAYKHEVDALVNSTNAEVNTQLESILRSVGLKTARQNFTYLSSGRAHAGENVYAILQAPRGDATEALVLMAAWRNAQGERNANGVALALTLARYFRRWSLWSKDIIFLFPPDSLAGPQAWVDAYHDAHDGRLVSALPLKSGALQGAVALDYASASTRFESVHIAYDGVNGQLPNLDLINSVVSVAGGQMGMGVSLQEMWRHCGGCYADRLRTMLRGMLRQALGAASGPHSAFMAYHVDAVTLRPHGDAGWHDEMAMGRAVEGTFRSLNNLLEHLHQSFFFYLLMGRDRFVSIGTYLPSAMLVAANFTIMAIALWVKSGQPVAEEVKVAAATGDEKEKKKDEKKEVSTSSASTTTTPAQALVAERDLFLPLAVVAACHALGIAPLYLFHHLPSALLTPALAVFSLLSFALPHGISYLLTTYYAPSAQQYMLVRSFSLLLLGMFLASLATLNFSLAFVVGLLASPLSFLSPLPKNKAARWAATLLLDLALSPPAVLAAACAFWGVSPRAALEAAAFAWDVGGAYTAVVVWCVWWPAWLAGAVGVLGRPGEGEGGSSGKEAGEGSRTGTGTGMGTGKTA